MPMTKIPKRVNEQVEEHIKLAQHGIKKVSELCDEALDHRITWYEFVDRLSSTVSMEVAMIETLPQSTGIHLTLSNEDAGSGGSKEKEKPQ